MRIRGSARGLNVVYVLSLMLLVSLIGVRSANADMIRIGDNDGYGFGLPDNESVVTYSYLGIPTWPGPTPGTAVTIDGTRYDGRSAAEAAATNGAQITDVYSALFPYTDVLGDVGPNAFTTADVIFPLAAGVFLNPGARLTIDLGDFQARSYGQIAAAFNGFVQPNLLNIYTPNGVFDEYGATSVMTFLINDLNAIGQANLDRQFVLTLTRGPEYATLGNATDKDYVAFDYFELNTDPAPVPEPATLTLFGTGAAVLGLRLRKKKIEQSR